ncbi:unnamed protein product [Phytophthora fragariaefolia]|uniref:Unnamed protein product n=1 Tax=Phytophthora fragariaefolia TaxID=1490495 RepID=A0A9W7CQA9_9STRA|nr:unnamed protein product [Phytophthora fragariaefolia]
MNEVTMVSADEVTTVQPTVGTTKMSRSGMKQRVRRRVEPTSDARPLKRSARRRIEAQQQRNLESGNGTEDGYTGVATADTQHVTNSMVPKTMSESTVELTTTADVPEVTTGGEVTAVMTTNSEMAPNTTTENGGIRKWKRVTFADPLVDDGERIEARREGREAVHEAVTGVVMDTAVTNVADVTKRTEYVPTQKPGEEDKTKIRTLGQRSPLAAAQPRTLTVARASPTESRVASTKSRPATVTAVTTTSKRPTPTLRRDEDEQRDEEGEGAGPWIAGKQPAADRSDAEPHQQELSRRRAGGPKLQLTDAGIMDAQRRCRLVQRLMETGEHHGHKVLKTFKLVTIATLRGNRVILPPALCPTVMKEWHDSVWVGYQRASHTYAHIAQMYQWTNLMREVKRRVAGCQECGSREARSREVTPSLRSIRDGDVGDRWALDVAGPLPTTDGGERFVIAAVEYVTRYAVATAVKQHTAENVAAFLMKNVLLKFGAFRELLTDGAPELTGKVVVQLVIMLQAQRINPAPYRPQTIGLVERFHRTWKDCIATYMHDEKQRDWDVWVDFAVYAYNSGQHSTVRLSPNQLMMGRKLRNHNDLLRRVNVTEAGALMDYNQRLVAAMESSHACAETARRREQEPQALL